MTVLSDTSRTSKSALRRRQPAAGFSAAELRQIHADPAACAAAIGLRYVDCSGPGFTRRRSGNGFRYLDDQGHAVAPAVRAAISQLVIPPAWTSVWISPDPDSHLLVTGVDDRGRKQYIYHPRWRTARDLLNFYGLMDFGADLPRIRQHVQAQLARESFDREQVLALMVRIIDLTAVRVGNDVYAEENESFGLSTLLNRHVSISGSTVHLSFPAKSNKRAEISIDDAEVAGLLGRLVGARPNRRLFVLHGEALDSTAVNALLNSLTQTHVTAKSFRTWAGTLAAFEHLLHEQRTAKRPERVVVHAIDQAAAVLGNTRSVARAHYVHPHVLSTFTEGTFPGYLARSRPARNPLLSGSERRLLGLLKVLFDTEFRLLRTDPDLSAPGPVARVAS